MGLASASDSDEHHTVEQLGELHLIVLILVEIFRVVLVFVGLCHCILVKL